MPKKPSTRGKKPERLPPRFSQGAEIEVAYGMLLPEFPGVSFEGWTGIIEKLDQRHKSPRYLVHWSEETLTGLKKAARKRLREIGLPYETMWLHEDDLEARGSGEPSSPSVVDPSYDASWDTGGRKGLDRKWLEWEGRDWDEWLKTKLSFPFKAKRIDDDDDAYFTDVPWREPFRLDSRMLVLGISGFDTWHDVILVEARQGRFRGDVPLNDLEVVSKNDPNYWPVEEYVVWHANRQ